MKRFLFFSFLIAVLTVFAVVGCKKKGAEEVVEAAGAVEESGDEVILEKPLEVGEEGG
jgi:hypothetical protein